MELHSAFSYAFCRRFAAQQRGRDQRDEQERRTEDARRAEPFAKEQKGKERRHHWAKALEQRDRARGDRAHGLVLQKSRATCRG